MSKNGKQRQHHHGVITVVFKVSAYQHYLLIVLQFLSLRMKLHKSVDNRPITLKVKATFCLNVNKHIYPIMTYITKKGDILGLYQFKLNTLFRNGLKIELQFGTLDNQPSQHRAGIERGKTARSPGIIKIYYLLSIIEFQDIENNFQIYNCSAVWLAICAWTPKVFGLSSAHSHMLTL